MYIDPFVFGIIVGCLGETVALVIWAYILGRKK